MNDGAVTPTPLVQVSATVVCGVVMVPFTVLVLCVQETQSPLMSSLPVDQPFRYDGPVGSHGREAGFFFHSSIVASPVPGTPDSQSLRWRLISGSPCVCSFYAPHAGIPSDTLIQFWRTLAASVHRVSQLHFGTTLLLAWGLQHLVLLFSSSVVLDKLMHLFCQYLAVSFPSFSEHS